MRVTASLALLSSLAVTSVAAAALDLDNIVGTWSSGTGKVLTGPNGIATDPVNNTFTYPGVSGYSFSFTSDGFYEMASITWNSNGTRPDCIEAVATWAHGTYVKNATMITTDSSMWPADGRVHVQNACAQNTSSLYYFTDAGLYKTWAVSEWRGNPTLRLGSFDASLLPRLFQISDDPTDYMWPTDYLSNATGTIL